MGTKKAKYTSKLFSKKQKVDHLKNKTMTTWGNFDF